MADRWRTAVIGLGANLGDRVSTLGAAVREIGRLAGLRRVRVSPLYHTRYVGPGVQPFYANGAVAVETTREPADLLRALLRIERRFGRTRPFPGSPRRIDLDLLLCGDRVTASADCVVPHPRFHRRAFAARPAADVAPALGHPALNAAVAQLARTARDGRPVSRLSAREQARFRRLAKARA